jgi:hypothetical protein
MKTLKLGLCACAALFGCLLSSPATVIVDDIWSTGVWTNWNLPNQSPWYYKPESKVTDNRYIGAVPGALIMTNYSSGLVSGTRHFWTFLTTNAPELTVWGFTNTNGCSNATNAIYGYPVDLDYGQMLTMTLRFSPSGVIMDSGTKGLRLGLLYYETNLPDGALSAASPFYFGRCPRNTSNITKSGTNVTGYTLEIPLFANLNNNLFSFRVRTNLNGAAESADPIGETIVYGSLGGGPTLVGSGFQPDQDYTLTWSIARYGSSNQVSATLSGPLLGVPFTNFSRAYLDGFGCNWHKFDTFVIRVDTSYPVCDQLVLKEFKVEVLPLPPFNIVTAHRIDADNFRLVWESLDGQSYRVESKADLTAPTWTSNATVAATGTTTTWTNTGTAGAPKRFYRIVNTQ